MPLSHPTDAIVHIAKTDEAILSCLPVIAQLRPHLTDPLAFLGQVKRQQSQGYDLAYLAPDGRVTAVAGFRLSECLYAGKCMYVDDLVTDANYRSMGHGQALFDWLLRYAASNQCTRLRLDSGVRRFDAHRFYLRNRMAITCHHFEVTLTAK